MTSTTLEYPKGARMVTRSWLTLAAALSLGACNILDTTPPDHVPFDEAIVNPSGARAALAGAYNELQDGFYYGGTMTHFGDLYADNANHTGTFTSYQDAALRAFYADNSDVTGMWNHMYDAIKRANTLIQKVPNVTGFGTGEQEQIMGESYFLRALTYHNLVKHFGGVPLRLVPVLGAGDTTTITRATVAEVYTQIQADLTQAESLMTNVTAPTNHATLGAVEAMQARIALWQQNYALAITKAEAVEALGYSLAPDYRDLFNNDNANTPENIFKLTFTAALDQANLLGYYWLTDQLDTGAGRFELGPTQSLIDAYDTLSGDKRLAWNILPDINGEGYIEGTQGGGSYGHKFPTPQGAEDFHVIRFAEVLLIHAEALAQTAQLDTAVAVYNRIRVRAGLPAHVFGTDVTTQQEVLDAIDRERRLEFAEEGDRWTDLLRTGRAQAVLGISAQQELFPIPLSEIEVAPGVTQNPGY